MDPFEKNWLPKTGIKIEKPQSSRIGPFFIAMLSLSLVLVVFTLTLLVLEGTGQSLPQFLKFQTS